jgi:hypothetical protein
MMNDDTTRDAAAVREAAETLLRKIGAHQEAGFKVGFYRNDGIELVARYALEAQAREAALQEALRDLEVVIQDAVSVGEMQGEDFRLLPWAALAEAATRYSHLTEALAAGGRGSAVDPDHHADRHDRAREQEPADEQE